MNIHMSIDAKRSEEDTLNETEKKDYHSINIYILVPMGCTGSK